MGNPDNSLPGVNQNRPGMDMVSGNMLPFLVMVLPYILIGFFVLLSVFNLNLKGFLYLVGIVMMISFSSIIVPPSPSNDMNRKNACRLFDIFGLTKGLPFSIMIYSFTLIYLLLPMYVFEQMNYQMMFLLILSIVLDIVFRLKYSCDSFTFILSAGILGTVMGIVWFSLVYAINLDLLYHTELVSDKLACSMNSEQKFSCKIQQIT
jgi:hypothetical protein